MAGEELPSVGHELVLVIYQEQQPELAFLVLVPCNKVFYSVVARNVSNLFSKLHGTKHHYAPLIANVKEQPILNLKKRIGLTPHLRWFVKRSRPIPCNVVAQILD